MSTESPVLLPPVSQPQHTKKYFEGLLNDFFTLYREFEDGRNELILAAKAAQADQSSLEESAIALPLAKYQDCLAAVHSHISQIEQIIAEGIIGFVDTTKQTANLQKIKNFVRSVELSKDFVQSVSTRSLSGGSGLKFAHRVPSPSHNSILEGLNLPGSDVHAVVEVAAQADVLPLSSSPRPQPQQEHSLEAVRHNKVRFETPTKQSFVAEERGGSEDFFGNDLDGEVDRLYGSGVLEEDERSGARAKAAKSKGRC